MIFVKKNFSFKPTYLPEDNPAEFSYFFDTSRRRTCYIAPERFKTRTITEATNQVLVYLQKLIDFRQTGLFIIILQALTSSIIPEESTTSTADEAEFANSGELSASMDIFSAGCVLIELFTEGAVPFNFSQLLAYR